VPKQANKATAACMNTHSPAVILACAGPIGLGMEFYIIAASEDDTNDFFNCESIACYLMLANEELTAVVSTGQRHPRLDHGGFTRMYCRRVPNSQNRAMHQTRGHHPYWRKILGRNISIVYDGNPGNSSIETRRDGLEILRDFYADINWNPNQPDDGWITEDITGETPYMMLPLCRSLMDSDIDEILHMQYNNEVLNIDFFSMYTDFALMLWNTIFYSIPQVAIDLGYGPCAHHRYLQQQ